MVIDALASALVTPRSRKVLAACEDQCYGAHDGLIEPRRRACGGVTKAPATSLRSRHRPRCLARHCGLSMWPLEYLQKTCTRPQMRGPGQRAGTGRWRGHAWTHCATGRQKEKPAASPFPRLGDGLALVPAQRLDGQPRPPQIGLGGRGNFSTKPETVMPTSVRTVPRSARLPRRRRSQRRRSWCYAKTWFRLLWVEG